MTNHVKLPCKLSRTLRAITAAAEPRAESSNNWTAGPTVRAFNRQR